MNAIYICHETQAFSSPKLQELFFSEGLKGYGTYWLLMEYLGQRHGYRGKMRHVGWLSKRIGTNAQYLLKIIRQYELFRIEGEEFFSPGLIDRMAPLEKKRARMAKVKGQVPEANCQCINESTCLFSPQEKKSKEKKNILPPLSPQGEGEEEEREREFFREELRKAIPGWPELETITPVETPETTPEPATGTVVATGGPEPETTRREQHYYLFPTLETETVEEPNHPEVVEAQQLRRTMAAKVHDPFRLTAVLPDDDDDPESGPRPDPSLYPPIEGVLYPEEATPPLYALNREKYNYECLLIWLNQIKVRDRKQRRAIITLANYGQLYTHFWYVSYHTDWRRIKSPATYLIAVMRRE
jgi:hypothetical protein